MGKSKSYPLVSIVVLNWDGLDDTKTCLNHVWALQYPNFEVVVVDNGSKDGSKEYFQGLDNIIYVDNPQNRGFTGGHIDGYKHCSGEFIVLLNNDAAIKADYLDKAMEHFSDPLVGAVGGRAYWWDETYELLDEKNPFYSYQEINIWTGEAQMLSHDYGVTQEVNNVSGSCVMVRRAVIEEVGYLYDRFFAYFEETDLFARMKRAGYSVLYDPRLHIWHRNGASSGASSGSFFFYYQIFRNRFIFATRNFEARYLLHFWWSYARLTVGSGMRWLLKKGDPIMHRAYFRAGLYNLLTLPYTLASRLRLWSRLGNTQYNHRIFSEQTGTSIVIDCSAANDALLHEVLDIITADHNPLHEYVLVVKDDKNLQRLKISANSRYIIDKGYFKVPAINLGCLAARFSWMLLCAADDMPNKSVIDSAIAHSLNSRVQLLAFGSSSRGRASYIFLHKVLFERVGGLANRSNGNSLNWLIHYASSIGHILWQPLPSDELHIVSVDELSPDEKHQLQRAIRFDQNLLKSKKVGWFGKLQDRYYRFYQLVTLIKWFFVWRVPLRLKLARLKNVFLGTLLLQLSTVALELKHMHNEVLLYGHQHFDVERQQRHTRQKLKSALSNPQDIPVFIICFERVEALRQLVGWLEAQGLHKIIFIDNDSTYLPLLEFYKHTPYQVLQLNRNIGHKAPWSLGIIRALVPEDFYIVTDPDVLPLEDCPANFLTYFLGLHKQFFEYQKVGFGLKIDDLPDYYPLKQSVIDWESQFWHFALTNEVYEAGIDTTFALYKPFIYTYFLHPSIRTGEPYLARHLPWYDNPKKVSAEERHYRLRLDPSVNSWNAEVLPERYQKEMG